MAADMSSMKSLFISINDCGVTLDEARSVQWGASSGRSKPSNTPSGRVRRGWELTFGHAPNEAQLANAEKFLQIQTKTFAQTKAEDTDAHRAALATFCQALLGSSRFLYIE